MSLSEPIWTHNGWFLLCPIKISDADSDTPTLAARWWMLEPWFTVNQWLQEASITMLSLLDPEYEPAFVIRITGERR